MGDVEVQDRGMELWGVGMLFEKERLENEMSKGYGGGLEVEMRSDVRRGMDLVWGEEGWEGDVG